MSCASCEKDLKDNKTQKPPFGAKICSDIRPWTSSVICGSEFSSSYALRKLFAYEEFESYWIALAKEQRKLELKTILVGVNLNTNLGSSTLS